LATAQQFHQVTVGRELESPLTTAQEPENIWPRASTWGLLLLLLYFALAGVSPFVNDPTSTRMVATSSAGGVVVDRLSKLMSILACMFFVLQRHEQVSRLCGQMKLVTSFPILALLLSPLSQLPTRTISSSALLLAGILLLYYIISLYSLNQILEL
jgi:exopolysaccharide production protein ExoQ